MTEIRVAVFGNGFARTVVLPCLRRVPQARVVGIASPNVERARATAAEFGIEQAANDHRAILDRCRPDLVYVVTPPHRHRDQAIDALDAGCHVVCEKPTALDATESAAMLAAARARPDRLALIDHELRFSPARVALRGLVRDGRLGTIHHASYTLLSPGRRDPSTPWTWWSDRACGGGALGAIGSHVVDSLRVLLGEVVETRGVLETFVRERPDPSTGRLRPVTADDLAAAWLRFSSGAIATLTISLVEGERVHRLTLAGSEGSARAEEQQPLRLQTGRDPQIELPAEDDLPPSAELGIPDTDWARCFLRLARRTVDAIRDGRAEVPGAATFEDGHRNQLVLDAVRASAAAGPTA
jgi:predicted dehydrogenase